MPSTNKHKRATRTKIYRPSKERVALDFRLIRWLEHAHESDPLCSVRPAYFILSNAQRLVLVRTQAKDIKSASDIKIILNENNEWAADWAQKIFVLIQEYDADLKTLNIQQKKAARVQKCLKT